MKVIAFDTPFFPDEFTTVRVYDTDTGALIQGVAGVPFAPTNGSTIIVGVYENYVFGYSTVFDEAEGKDAITAVFRSLIGVTPGSPITTTLAGDPSTRLIQDFYGYAQGSESIHILIDNKDGTSHRLANIVIGPGGVTYTEQTLGTMNTFYGDGAMLVEFVGGAKRIVTLPPGGDNLLRYSTPVGSGALDVAGAVTLYTAVDAFDDLQSVFLGITNTGRLANAMSALGTVAQLQAIYVYTWEGNSDGVGLTGAYMTGLTGNQATLCYTVEAGLGDPYTPRAELVAFDAGFTTHSVVQAADYPAQPSPPPRASIIPSPLVSTTAFWTKFIRAEEQP